MECKKLDSIGAIQKMKNKLAKYKVYKVELQEIQWKGREIMNLEELIQFNCGNRKIKLASKIMQHLLCEFMA